MNRRRVATMALLALASLSVGTVARAAGCAEAEHAGGDWPTYGQDLSNARAQSAETLIGADNVSSLEKKWAFSPQDEGGIGQIQLTPTVAEGCVYVTTSAGFIYALNADSGELVWKDRLSETVAGVCCGGTLFSPAVVDGVLYVNVSSNPASDPDTDGPHVIALDAQTGALLWRGDDVAGEFGSYTNSSAVYFDDMIFIGISNPESGFHRIGGYALVDATTGELIKRARTIPDDQADAGYAGGAIWSTPSVDSNGYAYAGTGQPSSWTGKESERTNAIVKIDLARQRDAEGNIILGADTITNRHFGEIVDSHKGTPDDPPYVDVDLAGSPTLYPDEDGFPMVAAFQKSGWLHATYTRHMEGGWSTPLSPFGTLYGNYSSTATDGQSIFGLGTFPGQLWSVDGHTGIPDWVLPIGNPMGANPVSYANGVVYHADGKGFLNAVDAGTGLPLLMRPMALDADDGEPCTNVGGGVSIARNRVFSVCGDRGIQAPAYAANNAASGWLIAYGLPA